MALYPEGAMPGPGPDKQVAIELKSIAESLKSIAKSQKEIAHLLERWQRPIPGLYRT